MQGNLGFDKVDPRQNIARFRAGWVSFPKIAQQKGAPAGIAVRSNADRPIDSTVAPAALLGELQRASTAGAIVTPIKYVHALDGKVDSVIDDGTPLPTDDAAIVHVSQTTTFMTTDALHVEMHVVICVRHAPGTSAQTPIASSAVGASGRQTAAGARK